jgi:hypothetical protein
MFISVSPAKPLPTRDTLGPTPVSQCGPVADLAARARDVDRLSQRIVPCLPSPLREHVGFAGLRNDRLLLLVESPTWATRVRMDQARILAAVHSLGYAASSVAAKVAPCLAISGDSATPRPLSSRGARTIREAASAIADPELRACFLELAARAESPAAS